MENRVAFFSLTAFLGALAIWRGTDTPNPSARVTSEALPQNRPGVLFSVRNVDSAISAYSRGGQLLAEFLGADPGALSRGNDSLKTGPAKDVAAKTAGGTLPALLALDFLIATVPDPHDSQQAWSYDAYLESINRAFAAKGYVQDRFWLPPKSDSVHITVPRGRPVAYALHDVHPGVILYRSTRSTRLALLYLVYEVPTTGIHRWAFAAAAREREELLSLPFVDPRSRNDTLLVLGPSFSGSSASLQRALDAALGRDNRLVARVVSGAATRVDPASFGSRISYRATVHSDAGLESGGRARRRSWD